jgi:hypothetical protein
MSEISTGDRHSPGLYEIRVNQAALHGLLQKVRDTGLPLLAVAQVEPDQPDMRTTDPR